MSEEEIKEEPLSTAKNELTDKEKEEKELGEAKKELVGKVTDTEIKDALSDEEDNFKDFFKIVKKYPNDKKLNFVILEHSDKFKEIVGRFRDILTATGKVSDPDHLILGLVKEAQTQDNADKFYEVVNDHKNMVHNSLLEQFYWYFVIGKTKEISEEKEKKAE